MSKSNKVKNLCKICLTTVNLKNGIKCQGACGTWVHFNCLYYTPGKIKDIKAGIIKVTCPCPNCQTSLPKEYRTDQPYSCNNKDCPALLPPKCINKACPLNKRNKKQADPCKGNQSPPIKCGNECKRNSIPIMPPPESFNPAPCPPHCHPHTYHPSHSALKIKSDGRIVCTSSCSSNTGSDTANAMPGDCGKYNSKLRTQAQVRSYHEVEQLCNTVGDLTNKINDLMFKMQHVVKENKDENDEVATCQANPLKQGTRVTSARVDHKDFENRNICKNPCFCPGNPGTKGTHALRD